MRKILGYWALLPVAVFLLWLYYTIKDIGIISKDLTISSVQPMLVLPLLTVGCTVYLGILRLVSQRKAGKRLFHLEFSRRGLFRSFRWLGLALTVLTIIDIFVSQVNVDAIHIMIGILNICVIFFLGMMGFSDTGIFEEGLLLPFSLVPFADMESYQWVDDEKVAFKYTARPARFRYNGFITFAIDPLQREALVAFLTKAQIHGDLWN